MKINTTASPYPLGKDFLDILVSEVKKSGKEPEQGVIINFKDDSYDPLQGGYHPVEIHISANGIIEYITDFAYVGSGHCAELAKEIDFDFSLGLFQHFGSEFPITEGLELYHIWEQNFINYHQMGVYRVAVSETCS